MTAIVLPCKATCLAARRLASAMCSASPATEFKRVTSPQPKLSSISIPSPFCKRPVSCAMMATFSTAAPSIAAPRLFLGAAENPFAPPLDFRPLRLQKKIEAGANFIQTQFCFDVPQLQRFMKAVRDLGLHERAFILVGVGPLRSARSAEWMRAHVPGVVIPEQLIRRLAALPAARQFEEGKRICLEIIAQIREIEGVHGVHVMAYHNEALATEIIAEAGLLPRPALRATEAVRSMQAGSMPS